MIRKSVNNSNNRKIIHTGITIHVLYHNQALCTAEQHLLLVMEERSHYWAICESSRTAVRDLFSNGDTSTLPPVGACVEPCSNDLVVHYAFHMAQQVHYPSDPFQPGPLYFLTPRKCGIFGVCCEAIPRQINYLIDEASDTGKGAISIVSMLQ